MVVFNSNDSSSNAAPVYRVFFEVENRLKRTKTTEKEPDFNTTIGLEKMLDMAWRWIRGKCQKSLIKTEREKFTKRPDDDSR